MTNNNSKKQVLIAFDTEIFTFYSKNSVAQDDTVTSGSFIVNADELTEISVNAICEYIINNKSLFFNIGKAKNIKKNNGFRAINCPLIFFTIIAGSKEIESYMFIKNIHKL